MLVGGFGCRTAMALGPATPGPVIADTETGATISAIALMPVAQSSPADPVGPGSLQLAMPALQGLSSVEPCANECGTCITSVCGE